MKKEWTPNSYSVVEQFAFENNMLEENLNFNLPTNNKIELRFYPMTSETIPFVSMDLMKQDGEIIKTVDYTDKDFVRGTLKNISVLIDNLKEFELI